MVISFHSIGLYDVVVIFAAAMISLIALARINDIDRDKTGKRWWMRRIGLLMVLASMVMTVSAYFTLTAPYWDAIRKMLFYLGVLISWMTTPNQPPFWKYISRNDSQE